jgi:hypothetical protein
MAIGHDISRLYVLPPMIVCLRIFFSLVSYAVHDKFEAGAGRAAILR